MRVYDFLQQQQQHHGNTQIEDRSEKDRTLLLLRLMLPYAGCCRITPVIHGYHVGQALQQQHPSTMRP